MLITEEKMGSYETKKQRWKQIQCRTWSDPDYSWLLVELKTAWDALENIEELCHGDLASQAPLYAREALES